MRLNFPKPDYRARFFLMGYGLILLIWISLEDNSALIVSILGSALAIISIGYWLLGRIGGQDLSLRSLFLAFPLLTAIMGGAGAFSTALLMFFKTAWHGHLYPDYPLEMMRDMLLKIPVWALAGFFIGLGLVLLFQFWKYENPIQAANQEQES